MAVPKKKVSYSRKSIRNANNKIKLVNIQKCILCNKYKKLHQTFNCCNIKVINYI